MRKVRVSIVVVAAALALLFAPRAAAQQPAMKLLTSKTGWVLLASGRLYWTTDGGSHWADITPPPARVVSPAGNPETIVSVFFLDVSSGWALLRSWDRAADGWRFDVASTGDSGGSWSDLKATFPNFARWSAVPAGGGSIDFVDSMHGWMDLDLQSSSAFRFGMLLETDDGGKTWDRAPSSPEAGGSIRFVTAGFGWLVGGGGNAGLYVTRDRSKTWGRVSPEAPRQIGPASSTAYSLPTFGDSEHGLLPVVYYRGPYGTRPALTVFATHDAGATWEPRWVLTDFPEAAHYGGGSVPVAVADSELLIAEISGLGRLSLKSVTRAGSVRGQAGTVAPGAPPDLGPVMHVSFVDPTRGWVFTGYLYSTNDGGATWTDITPRPRAAGRAAPPSPPNGGPRVSLRKLNSATGMGHGRPPTPLAGGGDGPHISVHLGFDTTALQSPAVMQTWWTYSPYSDVGVYLPGGATFGQSGLNSGWVSSVSGYGWGIVPFWDGPQAPCACKPNSGTYPNCTLFKSKFSSDSKQAHNDGTAQAGKAEKAAATAGLGGARAVIYYDLEQYDSSYCGASVTSFVSGWAEKLKGDGYTAGIYGAPADAANDWSRSSPLPDDVWVGKGDSRATTLGLGYGLSDTMWPNGQRAHQYLDNVTESYGGVVVQIDWDIEYAMVVGGSATKGYTFSYSEYAYPGADATATLGINNAGLGQVGPSLEDFVGTYSVDCAVSCQGYGFEELSGNAPSSISCGAGTAAYGINNALLVAGIGGGLGFWGGCNPVAQGQVFGINDDGQAVGWYADSSGNAQGFVYDTNTGTVVMNINFPGATNTYAYGINGLGQVVGNYDNGSFPPHGFVYDPGPFTPSGPYATVDVCGTDGNILHGISNNEQIVGYCASGPSETSLSFVCDYAQGTCSGSPGSISFPGLTTPTYVFGVNDGGQAVGELYGTPYGFLAVPQQ
jgi:probable HAF family extracellular repeat protein